MDRGLAALPGPSLPKRFFLVPLLVGLALTAALTVAALHSDRDLAQAQFRLQAERFAQHLGTELQSRMDIVHMAAVTAWPNAAAPVLPHGDPALSLTWFAEGEVPMRRLGGIAIHGEPATPHPALLEAVRQAQAGAAGAIAVVPDRQEVVIAVPGAAASAVPGVLAGAISLARLASAVDSPVGAVVTIDGDPGKRLVLGGGAAAEPPLTVVTLTLGGLPWVLELMPLRPLLPWHMGRMTALVLVAGLIMSAIAGVMLRRMARHAEARRQVILEDLGARHQAEERARYQASLLDQAADAVVAVNAEGRVVYANAAARRLFGWPEVMMADIHLKRLLATSLPPGDGNFETTGLRWDGTDFPAEVTVATMRDADGGTVLGITDLTPRRLLDQQLIHAARLATLGELAASITHEFNQGLHVIRLTAEALELGLRGPSDSGEVVAKAGTILAQVDRLTEMIQLMRSSSRRDPPEKRAFAIQDVLRAALFLMEPLLRSDGIRVVLDCPDDGLPPLFGHATRMQQVVMNLLHNARDAINERRAQEGPGEGAIAVGCRLQAGRVVLTVADDGIGLDAATMQHLFDPFYSTKGDKGCGLGLSVGRGIVQEIGGTLTCRPRERGAEFRIDLAPAQPARPVAPAVALPAADTDDDDEPAHSVLVVDDEPLSCQAAGDHLRRLGYRVTTAADGEEALAKCHAALFDLVITDLHMPRLDGRALIERLNELQPGTPVIVVTGDHRARREDLPSNTLAVLTKPLSFQDLRAYLAELA